MTKMKKILMISVILAVCFCCSSISQEEWMTNEAQIERVTLLPDSTNIYFIRWKGHLFLYDKSQSPCIVEIDTK